MISVKGSLRAVLVLFLFSLIVPVSCVYAETLKKPTVEYSADTHLVAGKTTITGRIYQTPTKRRGEMILGGRRNVVIVRGDLGLTWTLMVEQKAYMEHAKNAVSEDGGYADGMYDVDVELVRVGSEKIDGIDAEKSKVVVTDKNGMRNTGHMWITKDGILLKYVVDPNKSTGGQQIIMELKNLDIAPQAPALFDVPPDYTRITVVPDLAREPIDEKKMKQMRDEMEKRYGQ